MSNKEKARAVTTKKREPVWRLDTTSYGDGSRWLDREAGVSMVIKAGSDGVSERKLTIAAKAACRALNAAEKKRTK